MAECEGPVHSWELAHPSGHMLPWETPDESTSRRSDPAVTLTSSASAPDAAGRRVRRSLTLTGPLPVIAISQVLDVSTQDLWDAITIPERAVRWFGALEKGGGRYRLPGMGIAGRVLRREEPHLIVLTWDVGPETSTIEVVLRPRGEATEYTLRHTLPAGAEWEVFGAAATGLGWDTALLCLARHVNEPSADSSANLSDLTADEEGRAFVRACVRSWERLHAQAGADPATARACADRTLTFHLGGR